MAFQSSFLDAYTPWASRSPTPKATTAADPKEPEEHADTRPTRADKRHSGIDHAVKSRSWFPATDYPKDCPKIAARWFYATDAPKRKAAYSTIPQDATERLPKPKKFSLFSVSDSTAIETAFLKLVEDDASKAGHPGAKASDTKNRSLADGGEDEIDKGLDLGTTDASESMKVPVNEDFLFDVDIERRELGPAYWLGPIYDVRRGTWFYQEGASLRPCDENLSSQLEQGYLKIRPWAIVPSTAKPIGTQRATSRPSSVTADEITGLADEAQDVSDTTKDSKETPSGSQFATQTQRLFGAYMNSVVTYQDATTAWLLTGDFLSRMSSTVYQRFAGGGHLGGVKVVRGYSEANKNKDAKKDTEEASESNKKSSKLAEDNEAALAPTTDVEESRASTSSPPMSRLERQLSSYDPAEQEAEARQRDEEEIKSDYREPDGDDQGREIEHLLLVTHGIGQKLGLRLEMLNFIRDVNVLRKNLKAVYQNSPDLQILNNELEKLPKNCRIQVLPIAWRHLLDFPRQSPRHNQEHDVADMNEDDEYPSLDHITLEPSTIIRSVIRDLGLDILMYQSAYNEYISKIVVKECNRVHDIFMHRNPEFRGKISLIGHSLGSAILFDILCQQRDTLSSSARPRKSSMRRLQGEERNVPEATLKFDVEDYYCLGSPLGLYQMLNGRKIAARHNKYLGDASERIATDDPFLGAAASAKPASKDPFAISQSQPKCAQLFNIFHPADPIAYRLEPLISTAMNSLKPQPLPYTKRGLFDMQGQGLSAIGNRVGQSVSGLWSSVTSNVASTFLNRSLGLTADSRATSSTPQIEQKPSHPAGLGSGPVRGASGDEAERPATLIDGELETLYTGFQKAKLSHPSQDPDAEATWDETDARLKKLRREEAKVRALNSNGRVDFCIQPGVFDMTNPMASFASHMCYWGDEDVSHFMISQLLSRQRVVMDNK